MLYTGTRYSSTNTDPKMLPTFGNQPIVVRNYKNPDFEGHWFFGSHGLQCRGLSGQKRRKENNFLHISFIGVSSLHRECHHTLCHHTLLILSTSSIMTQTNNKVFGDSLGGLQCKGVSVFRYSIHMLHARERNVHTNRARTCKHTLLHVHAWGRNVITN